MRLTDETASPVAGATIKFDVTAGEAFFDRTNTTTLELSTNAEGVASASSRYSEAMSGLVAGAGYTGSITVEASVTGSSASFTFDQIHSTVAERLEYVAGRDQQLRSPYEVLKPLSVRAVDGDGHPVPDTQIEFAAKDGTANFAWSYPTATIATDQDGVASTSEGHNYYQVLRSGVSPEGYAVAADVEARLAGAEPVPFSIPLAPVERIEILSGDNQEVAGEDYYQPLQAVLRDADGQTLAYRRTAFVVNGEAHFTNTSEAQKTLEVSSQWDGTVTVPRYTLRANGGHTAAGTSLTVSTSSGDKSTDFHLKVAGQPRAWNLMPEYGSGQTTAAGDAFASPLGVYARDEQGRAAGYAPVTFEIINGGGAYFAVADGTRTTALTVEADRYGRASTPPLRSGNTLGSFTVKATTPDFAGQVAFDLDVVGQPASVRLYPETGTTAYPDSSLGWPYAVVTDSDGRPVGNQTVTFTVESGAVGIGRSTDGSEKIRTGITDSNGVAYAGDALYTGAGKSAYGPAAVSATLTGGQRADASYTVVSYPAVKQLLVAGGEGLSARPGEVFGAVDILADSQTWPYAGYTDVTFELGGSTGSYFVDGQGQRVDGPVTVTASRYGYAQAPTIIAGETPGSVSLSASAPNVPNVQVNLSVSGGASGITKTSQDGLQVLPEDSFGYLSVRVQDEAGNPVGNEEVTFTVREGAASFSGYWWGYCGGQASGNKTVTVRSDPFGNAYSSVALCADAGPDAPGEVIVDVAAAGIQGEPFTFTVKSFPAAAALHTYDQASPHIKTGEDLYGFPYAYARDSSGNSAGYAEVTYRIEGDTGARFKITDPATGIISLEEQVVLRADRWGNLPTPTIAAGETRGTFSVTARSGESNELRWDGLRVVGPIASVTAIAGDGQKLYPNNYTSGLRVVARDSDGYAVPNQVVTFMLPPELEHRFAYTWSTAVAATTDANGEAAPGYSYYSGVYLGSTTGPFTVSVEHGSQTYTPFSLEALAYPVANVLDNLGGGGQSVQPNSGFPARLSARVSNSDTAVGIPNVPVTWAIEGATDAYFVLDNGARASSAATTSDAAGYVVAPALFAGSQGGSFTVTATADGISPAVFDLAVLSSARILEKVAGDGQVAKVGKTFDPVQVVVKDDAGNPVANQRVRFTAEAPSRANFAGTFRTYAITDSQGRASSGPITAGAETGEAAITAASGTLEPQTFTLTTEPLARPAVLTEATGSGQSIPARGVFPVPLGIRALDAEDNPTEQVSVTFTVTGSSGSTFADGAATYTGKTNADGWVYSPLVSAGAAAGTLSVVATAEGVAPFAYDLTIKDPNTAPQLELATSAAAVEIGKPVTYTLNATDADGDPLSYAIDFGDGAGVEGRYPSSQTITHAYTQAGSYLVHATVRDAAGSTSTTARISVVLPEPLLADAGEPQQAETGQPVLFDAGRSKPLPLIQEAIWDFGDGSTGSGLRAQHVYSTAGEFVVSLTVRNGSETATSSTTVKVEQASVLPGLAVTVKSGANLLSGAVVTINLSDGRRVTATSGTDGVAVLRGLPDGEHSVFVSAGGHLPVVVQGVVSAGTGNAEAVLTSGDVGSAVIDTRTLTMDQIVDLGIDPAAPENQQVFESEIHLAVNGEEAAEAPPIQVFWNIEDKIGVRTDPYAPVHWVGTTATGLTIGDYDFAPSTTTVGGQRIVQWLIVPTRGSYLKEFFEARLVVQNLSDAAFTFSKGQAEIALPAGISLAPTAALQTALVPAADIPGGGSATIYWTLRGDTEGEYNIAATYTGVLEPVGAPVRLEASTEKPLKVWGGSALEMEVIADPSAEELHPFRVTVKLRNQTPDGSGIPVYNPAFEVLAGTNYLLAPDVDYKMSAAALLPGEVLEKDFIVYSLGSGDIGIDDEDLRKSFIVSTGGSVDVDYAPVRTAHSSRTEDLNVKGVWGGPLLDMELTVGWQGTGDAAEYFLFSRDDLDSGEWNLVTEGHIPLLPVVRELSGGSSQLGKYYAVVTKLSGGAVVPKHRILQMPINPPVVIPETNGGSAIGGSSTDPAQCVDVLFIGAAGSGEGLLGNGIQSLANKLSEQLGADRSYKTVRVDYPAAPVPVVSFNVTVDPVDYVSSIESGVIELKRFLTKRAEKNCVDEKYVLAGYSQGGIVVSRAISESPELVPGDKVAGAFLLANASNSPVIGGQTWGTAQYKFGVSRPIWRPTVPVHLADRTYSLCDENDMVCDTLTTVASESASPVVCDASSTSICDDLTAVLCHANVAAKLACDGTRYIDGYLVHTSYHVKRDAALHEFAKLTRDRLMRVAVPKADPHTVEAAGNGRFQTKLETKTMEGATALWRLDSETLPPGVELAVAADGGVSGKVPPGFWKFPVSVIGDPGFGRRATTLEVRAGWAAEVALIFPQTVLAPESELKPYRVKLLDSAGNAVARAEVEFKIEGPASFAGGSQSYKVLSDAKGYADSLIPVSTGANGTIAATATVPGRTPMTLHPQEVVPQVLPNGVSAVVTPKFLAGKVILEVQVSNSSNESQRVTLESRFGIKDLGEIAPGSAATHTFDTEQKQTPQGSVRVSAFGAASSGSEVKNYAAYNPAAGQKPTKAVP
ncbi:PKD domain-containing protein [Arthrobacter sp. OV608]|uniref:PKD domain-containing protein n=1 Tax=Arthrobacter sp. OV608 TaxID=1882768 RepID=UPI00147C1218|nr:PKD domain-containing protein [Arthrobacter sp. OV608]